MRKHPRLFKQNGARSGVGLIVCNARTFSVDDLTRERGLTLMLGKINTSSDSA